MRHFLPANYVASLLVMLVLASAAASARDAERAGHLAEALEYKLEELSSSKAATAAGQSLHLHAEVLGLYESLDGEPGWVNADGVSSQGAVLLEILESVPHEGLNPADYHANALLALRQRIQDEANAAIAEALAVRAARAEEIAAELAMLQQEARTRAEAEKMVAAEKSAASDDDDDDAQDDEDVDDESRADNADADQAPVAGEDELAQQAEAERTALAALPPPVAPPPRLPLLVDLEILLSDAYMRLAQHRSRGVLDPGTLELSWHLEGRSPVPLKQLYAAVKNGQVRQQLQALKPPSPEYLALETALQRYRAIEAKGGFPGVDGGSLLKPGMKDARRVPQLRSWLRVSGDLPADAGNGDKEYDNALARAVRSFQARHGLKVDAVVGPNTVQMLNLPISDKIEAIKTNLERWRWMPEKLGDPHIRVNVAAFHMEVIENGQRVLDMPTIVGMPDRRTPNFSETMKYLVANPTWEVPPSIAKKDKLPILRQNLGYLTEHGFDVLQGWGENEKLIDPKTLDWSKFNEKYFPYHLRQQPGPTNALGRIKFMLPNRYNIYLHDTPAKHLFDANARAFSSGCIRLERPLELADYILGRDPRWRGKDIRKILEGQPKQTLRLQNHIPVHILYWTAWADDAGVVHFREDVYNRDRVVIGALHQKTVASQ